jgi:hypothetical protein
VRLDYQTKQNTSFPYLWCHGCGTAQDEGLSIAGENNDFWLRLCPTCLDEINTYMQRYYRLDTRTDPSEARG